MEQRDLTKGIEASSGRLKWTPFPASSNHMLLVPDHALFSHFLRPHRVLLWIGGRYILMTVGGWRRRIILMCLSPLERFGFPDCLLACHADWAPL